jgi:hypothetical protein
VFLLSTRQCAGYSWIPLILGIQAQADSIWILTLNLYRDVQKVWIPSCLVLPSLPFLCIYLFLFILAFCLGEERLSASLASISAIHLFWHQAHCFTAFPGLFQSPFHSYILILGKKKIFTSFHCYVPQEAAIDFCLLLPSLQSLHSQGHRRRSVWFVSHKP